LVSYIFNFEIFDKLTVIKSVAILTCTQIIEYVTG